MDRIDLRSCERKVQFKGENKTIGVFLNNFE